jgi:hypothetical protein
MGEAGQRSPTFRAPSFSWASMDGIVKFHKIRQNARFAAEILDFNYAAKGVDLYGLCQSGTLTIRGPTKRVEIFKDFFPKWGLDLKTVSDTVRAGLQPLNDPANRVGWQPDEKLDASSELFTDSSLKFYCVEIVRVETETFTFSRRTHYELGAVYSLVVVLDEKSNTYRRLGCCCDRKYTGESAEQTVITLI